MWGTQISCFSPIITEYNEFQLKYCILDKGVMMIRAVRKSFFPHVYIFHCQNHHQHVILVVNIIFNIISIYV